MPPLSVRKGTFQLPKGGLSENVLSPTPPGTLPKPSDDGIGKAKTTAVFICYTMNITVQFSCRKISAKSIFSS